MGGGMEIDDDKATWFCGNSVTMHEIAHIFRSIWE